MRPKFVERFEEMGVALPRGIFAWRITAAITVEARLRIEGRQRVETDVAKAPITQNLPG